MRTQRSMADISSARTAATRTQTLPPPPLPRGVRDVPRIERSRGHSSSSSQSSHASSTFDGRKRSYDSNTSLEDDRDYKPSRDRGGVTSSRRPRERYPREEEEEVPEEEPPAGSGHGASIWNAITGIAGALTVNVSKAWDGGTFPAADGEVTPAGQESSLTKAMKDYHLKSARSAKDLPQWLFDEGELRGKRDEEGGRTSSRKKAWQDDSRSSPRDRDRDEDRAAPAPRRGLRDIYEQASASPSTKTFADSRATALSSSRDGNSSTTASSTSKASSRLKALKDAKRAASGTSGRGGGYDEDTPVEVYDDRPSATQNETPAPRRVGLPTGPRRR